MEVLKTRGKASVNNTSYGTLGMLMNDKTLFDIVVRKPTFCICENKDADQLVTAKLIIAFVFATQIEQSLYFLNPKFQASSHLL